MKWPIPQVGETWTTRKAGADAVITRVGPAWYTRAVCEIEWHSKGKLRTSTVSMFTKRHRPPVAVKLARRITPQTGETWGTEAGARIFITDGGDQSAYPRRRRVMYTVLVGRTALRTGATRSANAADLSYHWTKVEDAAVLAAAC